MKLTTIMHVSVDGVMQGLGGADEDRSGGFERGGWALPLFDNEAETFLAEIFQRGDPFLFGRRTYEIFAARRRDDPHHPDRHQNRFWWSGTVCAAVGGGVVASGVPPEGT